MTGQITNSRPGFVERVFSLDLRSLALFRIAIGILILVDLGFRWSTLTDMYTGDGFYTHALADKYNQVELGQQWPQFVWSVYWLSDSVIFVQSMFAIAALAAMFLILGKWTRIATIVSWILLASLHVRNPLVTTSGDFLFKMLLFWSMFLPIGAKWSLDSRKNPTENTAVCSFATIGLLFQMFAIYFFPGVAKCNQVWFSGDAMWYVLRLDIYITEFGRSMLEFPFALKLVSWLTLFFEVIWVWTLFVPWKNGLFRLSNIVIFSLFHVGIALCMAIGLFPLICIVGWVAGAARDGLATRNAHGTSSGLHQTQLRANGEAGGGIVLRLDSAVDHRLERFQHRPSNYKKTAIPTVGAACESGGSGSGISNVWRST